MVQPFPTVIARPAAKDRIQCDAHPWRNVLHVPAHPDDFSGNFMASDDGIRDLEFPGE